MEMDGLSSGSRANPPQRTWHADSDDDEDDGMDEESSLRPGTTGYDSSTSPRGYNVDSNGMNNDGDDGESGHVRRSHTEHEDDLEAENEKGFKYYKHLPDHNNLSDAKRKVPGRKAVGGGMALLVGIGYLIAYLCTSVGLV
jgi:hypothetical protein